jgi:hypothetical protein
MNVCTKERDVEPILILGHFGLSKSSFLPFVELNKFCLSELCKICSLSSHPNAKVASIVIKEEHHLIVDLIFFLNDNTSI